MRASLVEDLERAAREGGRRLPPAGALAEGGAKHRGVLHAEEHHVPAHLVLGGVEQRVGRRHPCVEIVERPPVAAAAAGRGEGRVAALHRQTAEEAGTARVGGVEERARAARHEQHHIIPHEAVLARRAPGRVVDGERPRADGVPHFLRRHDRLPLPLRHRHLERLGADGVSSVCANVPRAAAAHAGTSTIESATARERRVSRSSAP